jgi:gliding motility-associated-like protein
LYPYGWSYGMAVATDNLSNIYFTGYSKGSIQIGTTTLAPTNLSNTAFLVKLDAGGNVIWARESVCASSSSRSVSSGVTTDALGNIYLTGYFSDTVSFGGYTLIQPGGNDIFIVKYDTNGNVLWAKQSIAQNGNCASFSIELDKSNHIYISGGFGPNNHSLPNSISFGSASLTSNFVGGRDPAFVVEFDSLGNYLCGSMILSGGDDNNGIAVDRNGSNLYFAGDLMDAVKFGVDYLDPGSFGEAPFLACWKPCTSPESNPDCSVLYIPNTFSPNDDGMNDLECVYGNCIKTIDFSIYDRWGEQVFHSTDATKLCWDGIYQGKPMNTAVFAFYMHAVLNTGKVITQKGTINLIR